MVSTGTGARISSASGATGHAATPRNKLDKKGLDGAVDFVCGQALVDSTRRTYAAAKKRYVRFCTTHYVLPSTEQNLYRYVASLVKEGMRATSIKYYLSAVRHLHIEEGWGTPNMADMPKLELVIRGIKKHRERQVMLDPGSQ